MQTTCTLTRHNNNETVLSHPTGAKLLPPTLPVRLRLVHVYSQHVVALAAVGALDGAGAEQRQSRTRQLLALVRKGRQGGCGHLKEPKDAERKHLQAS
jgi:hypothetical protein